MGRGGVAFVLGVAVGGVLGVQAHHDAVAFYFGQDGGGHDAGVDGVTVNDGGAKGGDSWGNVGPIY